MIGAGILLTLAFFLALAALRASEIPGGSFDYSRLKLMLGFAVCLAVVSVLVFWLEYRHRVALIPTADEIAKKIIEKLSERWL